MRLVSMISVMVAALFMLAGCKGKTETPEEKKGEEKKVEQVEKKAVDKPEENKAEEKKEEAVAEEKKEEAVAEEKKEEAVAEEKKDEAVAEEKKEEPVNAEKAGGVVTTESGLQYEDVAVGDGATPEKGKRVTVHYTGKLTNGKGKKFDSSVDRGQPFTFVIGVGQVIRGWDEGVMSMKVGGKRELTIPPDLGYGARGAGGVIPPNATLFFEVELLGVQ